MPKRRHRAVVGFVLAAALLVALGGRADAHSMLVFGNAEVLPNPPAAGAPVTIVLDLAAAGDVPVNDAIVDLTATAPSGTVDASVTFELRDEGRYRAMWTPSEPGTYALRFTDRTLAGEVVEQTQPLDIGGDAPVPALDLIFVPTNGASGTPLRVWLIWLIAVPVGVALIVVGASLLTRPGGVDANSRASADDSERPPSGG